jgi:hypothetical protein
MTQLLLRCDGSDVAYQVATAQFDTTDNSLDLCLELEIDDNSNEDAPPEIQIRFTNLECDDDGNGIHIRTHNDFGEGDYYNHPNAFVYSGFHHEHVTAWITIESQDDAELKAELKIVTGDVDRYDEHATDNTIAGRCVFCRATKHDMWGP